MEGRHEDLMALGISSHMAKRALLAFPDDIEKTANWAFTSASRHKFHCTGEHAPRSLLPAFDDAEGVLALPWEV